MLRKMKKDKTSVDELIKNELDRLDISKEIQSLKIENKNNEKAILEFKEKEKQSARALILCERKLSFIKHQLSNKLENIMKKVDNDAFSRYEISSDVKFLIEELDKEFGVKSKEKTILDENLDDANSIEARFNRLKEEYERKIGDSASRTRGRPKRENQSITADIGIGGNKSKVNSEKRKNQTRLDNLFYTSPEAQTSAKSGVPQTDDSIFDFDEALNPNISLSDIMNDIANESEDSRDKKKMSKIELLESGYISKPKIKK